MKKTYYRLLGNIKEIVRKTQSNFREFVEKFWRNFEETSEKFEEKIKFSDTEENILEKS